MSFARNHSWRVIVPGAQRRVFRFLGAFFAAARGLGFPGISARRSPRRKLGPLMESGSTFFDNSKAGKFTPRTLGRLRSAWRSDGVDYYKFCSSMLSSNCGFNKANSVKHLFHAESIARRRASGPRKNGAAESRADEPAESCGIATAARFGLRKRCEAPWETTY